MGTTSSRLLPRVTRAKSKEVSQPRAGVGRQRGRGKVPSRNHARDSTHKAQIRRTKQIKHNLFFSIILRRDHRLRTNTMIYHCMYECMEVTYSKRKDQPGKGYQSCSWSAEQGKLIFPCPRSHLNLISRDGFGSPVQRQPAHLYTWAESGAYLRDSFRVPRRRPFIFSNHHNFGSVPSLSGHANAY